MGLTVPDFPTKWNTTTSAYISTTGCTLQIYPIAVGPIVEVVNDVQVVHAGQWNVVTEFKVYRDKQHRVDSPFQHVELLKVAAPVYTEQVVSDGVFTILYNKLKEMFPNGVDDFTETLSPTVPDPIDMSGSENPV